jgi:hypothetical protein
MDQKAAFLSPVFLTWKVECMAFDRVIAERIRDQLRVRTDISERKMCGGPVFMSMARRPDIRRNH